MNFKEWLKNNNIVVIHNLMELKYENLENIIGKRFWICDYRLNSKKDSKPIRNVPPKLVQVFSNDDLPKNKRVYYSPVHFREVKNDKILSTIIAPYDNTGYRAYTGISLNIFKTELECVNCFNKQCDEAIKEYEDELKRRTDEINSRINEIENLKINNKEK